MSQYQISPQPSATRYTEGLFDPNAMLSVASQAGSFSRHSSSCFGIMTPRKTGFEEDYLLETAEMERKSCSECSTPSDLRAQREYEKQFSEYDNRLQYWRNYLKSRENIKERIKTITSKTDCEILLNQNQDYNRVQLVKTIFDYADRLKPAPYKEPLTGKEIPCLPDVWQSLPTSDKTGEYPFGVHDLPAVSRTEQGLGDCPESRSNSWLNSKELERTVIDRRNKVLDILPFYPDTNNLQMIGQKIILQDRNEEKSQSKFKSFETTTESITADRSKSLSLSSCVEIKITDPNKSKQQSLEHMLIINEKHYLYASQKVTSKLKICIQFQAKNSEKNQNYLITLRNAGEKTIDFEWKKDDFVVLSKFSNVFQSTPPVFHFDKNPFRVTAGEELEIPVIFYSNYTGIFSEQWTLISDPDFFSSPGKISVNLFGCSESDKTDFNDLKENLIDKANNLMAEKFLSSCSTTVAEQIYEDMTPIIDRANEIEIFDALNPWLKVSQNAIEKLKKLHSRVFQELEISSLCPNWNYEIETLKSNILKINNDAKRRVYYFELVEIVRGIKNSSFETINNYYGEQKLMLVRTAILGCMEKIYDIVDNLKSSLTKTELNLDFNEVIILNYLKKPKKMKFYEKKIVCNSDSKDDIKEDISEKSFAIVKSSGIKEKIDTVLEDALYIHIAANLGQMIDEIVVIIEGMKPFYSSI